MGRHSKPYPARRLHPYHAGALSAQAPSRARVPPTVNTRRDRHGVVSRSLPRPWFEWSDTALTPRQAPAARGDLKAGSFSEPDIPLFAGGGLRRIRSLIPITAMKHPADTKCQHCHEGFLADCRNLGRQRFCQKPDCRRASKASSQRQWRSRPENRDYFRGTYHCERVRRWRRDNPHYCRRKPSPPECALQDSSAALQDSSNVFQNSSQVLEELCFQQPALMVGLIALVTGLALQDDIAASVGSLLNRGREILRRMQGGPFLQNHENPSRSAPRPVAARASPG